MNNFDLKKYLREGKLYEENQPPKFKIGDYVQPIEGATAYMNDEPRGTITSKYIGVVEDVKVNRPEKLRIMDGEYLYAVEKLNYKGRNKNSYDFKESDLESIPNPREGELNENEMESDIVSFLQSNKDELLQTLAAKFGWGEDDIEEYSGMGIEMADEGIAGLGEGGLDFSFDRSKVADEYGDASTFEIEVAGKPVYGISYNF